MDRVDDAAREAILAGGATPEAAKRLEVALQGCTFSSSATFRGMAADSRKAQAAYRAGNAILSALPPKPSRDQPQSRSASAVKEMLRGVRNAFGRSYAKLIYESLTDGYRRCIRVEELAYAAAALCPGLCPTRQEVESELGIPLAHKDGVELAQGDFISHIFACRETGTHLLHAMLRPLPESQELLARFRRDGRVDLGKVQVERRGSLGGVFFNNISYLNAEDDGTVLPLETAIDLVLLDPHIEAGLLRGNVVEHPKYRGRRIFSSGLNLSHLYEGKLSLMFYLTRDLGLVNKLYRGLATGDYHPDGPEETLEKPWAGAVEGFAIGGGCQILLVLDYVIAEEGAYCNLPARKEGIVPGAAPLRFSRFVGERQAQAGILFDEPFPVDSAKGRALVNEVVPPEGMDEAIERFAAASSGSGVVSAAANRKAMRLAQEPLDLFRQYMALYCRVQGDCHFSPALVKNLERHWVSRQRPSASL